MSAGRRLEEPRVPAGTSAVVHGGTQTAAKSLPALRNHSGFSSEVDETHFLFVLFTITHHRRQRVCVGGAGLLQCHGRPGEQRSCSFPPD